MNNTEKNVHEIDIIYKDKIFTIKNNKSKTLLEIIEQHNIPVKYGCRKGFCGSCRIELVNGKLDSVNSKRHESHVLACCSQVESEATLRVIC